ncbi:unnamed protein product [Amoebophrya sp. A120]|nr:unnamed protein product [Amoebophrya sp. A120]|eukprot:GSA120T00011426001.1
MDVEALHWDGGASAWPKGRLVPYTSKLCYFDFDSFPDRGQGRKSKLCILLPGLGDGFCTVPWLSCLGEKLVEQGDWLVVQPVLRSSYSQFGFHTLADDVQDIEELLAAVKGRVVTGMAPIQDLLLVGHSTGCQIFLRWLVHYCEKLNAVNASSDRILDSMPEYGKIQIILQGAVSDREATNQILSNDPDAVKLLQQELERNENSDSKEHLLESATLAHKAFDTPAITKYRAASLYGKLTEDDLFSTDLTDENLAHIFEPVKQFLAREPSVRLQIHFLLSPEDEFATLKTRDEYKKFLQRYCGVLNDIGDRDHLASYSLYSGSHNGEDVSEALAAASLAFAISAPTLRTNFVADAVDFFEKVPGRNQGHHHFIDHVRIIGLVGVPGSGKSTASDLLRRVYPGLEILPVDGFHIPLERLREEQGDAGVYWRGAPETFDHDALVAKLSEIRQILHKDADNVQKGYGNKDVLPTVDWPAFDHARGDPVYEEGVGVCLKLSGKFKAQSFKAARTRILLLEGLYPLYWPEVRRYLDGAIVLDTVTVDEAVERLKIRNQCIPGYTKEEIFARCEEVDRSNANLVAKSMHAVVENFERAPSFFSGFPVLRITD